MDFKKPGELFLQTAKKNNKVCLKDFRLDFDFQAIRIVQIPFLLYFAVFLSIFYHFNEPMHLFPSKYKEISGASRLLQIIVDEF